MVLPGCPVSAPAPACPRTAGMTGRQDPAKANQGQMCALACTRYRAWAYFRRRPPDKCLILLERVKGIEPSSSAWKAVALPLSYTRAEN